VDLKAVLGERLKKTARSRECNLAAVAIKETCSSLIFQSSYLGGNGWLRYAKLLSGARKALQPAYFQKSPELLKIHVNKV
jgi:hypothetical protein